MTREVGIAGAGIAGLAAAALLARAGHRVRVFDRFEAPAHVGSGLMVQPVGLAVLAELGLDGPLRERAAPVARIFGRSQPSGRVVLDVRYRGGAAGLGVQRAALFDLLLGAAREAGAELVPATAITGAEERHLLAGTRRLGPFDLMVDALGFASVLCPEPARPLAYGALWGLVDWPDGTALDPAALEQRYERAARMIGVLPVGRLAPGAPRRLTFFWSLRADRLEAWRAAPFAAWQAEAAALWPEAAPVVAGLAPGQLTFARYGHRTLAHPVTGRLAHLGDSFHCTSPQLGQGANMALLDALALARAVERHAEPADALAAYARLRRRHVRLYQAASRLFTPVYQSDSRVLPWIRDRVMGPISRMPPAPAILAALVAGTIGRPLAGLTSRR